MVFVKIDLDERISKCLDQSDLFPIYFTDDEKEKLLLDFENSETSIESFYEYFGISKKRMEKAARKNKTDSVFFAGFFFDSLESFFNYKLPDSLIEITDNKVKGLDTIASDMYQDICDNPPPFGPISSRLAKVCDNFCGFIFWLTSFGQCMMPSYSPEEHFKMSIPYDEEKLTERFQKDLYWEFKKGIAQETLLKYISLKYDMPLVFSVEGYRAAMPIKIPS